MSRRVLTKYSPLQLCDSVDEMPNPEYCVSLRVVQYRECAEVEPECSGKPNTDELEAIVVDDSFDESR